MSHLEFVSNSFRVNLDNVNTRDYHSYVCCCVGISSPKIVCLRATCCRRQDGPQTR